MLTLPPSTHVFVATRPADMRLEEGVFTFPRAAVGEGETVRLEMSSADLQLVLQGIDPAKVKRSQRYQLPANT